MSPEQPRPSGNLRNLRGQPVLSDDASSQALSEALGSSFILVRLLIVALIAAFAISCIFTVKPNEVAVVLRFGAPVGVGPGMIKSQGLHFAFPFPIDEVVRIRNGETLSATTMTSWYQMSPEDLVANKEPDPNDRLNPAADGYVITGDNNILHARATLKYRISDPLAYTFRFGNASNLIVHALDNALYRTAAGFRADEALYKDKAGFRSAVQRRFEDWVGRTGLGITVDVLEVPVTAPGFVSKAFDAVTKAEQEQSSKISQARGDADKLTHEAHGVAQEIIGRSTVTSNALVQAVLADADAFVRQEPYYRSNPDLFRSRLLQQTLERVYTNATEKFVVDSHELRILLNRPPVTPTKAPPPPAP